MNIFATKMLNDIISFIKESLSINYCELRNDTLFNRVKNIMNRYDFSNSLSLESLKTTLDDLTIPDSTKLTKIGWMQIVLSPFLGLEEIAERFLASNQAEIEGFMGAVIQSYSESFKKDVETIFTDLVQRVRNDFDETEKKLSMNKSEQEKTEKMLAAYHKEVNVIFDNLTEIRKQIKRFATSEQ